MNLCSHTDAVLRVLQQIDGLGVQPTCGNSNTATFPPRNEPLDFMIQLEAKYRDGLRRLAGLSFVDVEGNIVWTQEYLRYRVSSCTHLDAQQKVFDQIDGRGLQADCKICSAPPVMPGGFVLGWTTAGFPSGSVQLLWDAATGVVTSYVVELGTTRGAANVRVVDTGSAATSHTFAGLAPGDYFARIRAINPCGVSGPSNEANPRVR